jgi:aryl-alcohol dehydrogenase-like predicted oxidoreductase
MRWRLVQVAFAAMETVHLGESGLRVSRVGLGTNNFGGRIGAEETRAVVEAALDAGITFFDTAEVYGGGGGSERLLGEILEGRRDRVVLATKFGWHSNDGHGAARNVENAVAGSLERLRTDYLDLYYLHKPDPGTPIGETLGALHELVEAGTVRAIGCSNFSAEQLAEADRAARERGTTRFTVLQNHFNLLRRDDDADVLPLANSGSRTCRTSRSRAGSSPGSTGAASQRRTGRDSRAGRSTRSSSTASRRSSASPRGAGTRCTSSPSPRSPRHRGSAL